jgi:hypothetical protein
MKSSIHRFTFDVQKSQSQISIPVMLGDTGREWHVNLSDGGRPYIIADGCLVMLSIKRPTGTQAEMFCPIVGNTTIVVDFAQYDNICAVEGIHECDFTVYGADKKVITTARFTMVVSDRAVPRADIVLTDDDRTVLDDMISEEAIRRNNETQRISSESARKSAEDERVSSENARATAEAERVTKDFQRDAIIRDVTIASNIATNDSQEAIRTVGDVNTALDNIIAIQETIIGYRGLMNFYFNHQCCGGTHTFTAEKGMTWEDWLASYYDKSCPTRVPCRLGGFYNEDFVGDVGVVFDGGSDVLLDENGDVLRVTDVIVEGATYSCTQAAIFPADGGDTE